MTTALLLQDVLRIEEAMTRRMLERVPADRPSWTPHPKSMPMGRLAAHVAELPWTAVACLSTDEFDISRGAVPPSVSAARPSLLETFNAGTARAHELLAQATEDQLAATWTMRAGDHILLQNPRSIILLHVYLGHMIHHRAQLGTYLRLNDIAVPGVYGPSADEKEKP